MEVYIERRVLDIASYIIETGSTVRAAAKEFGVSKSTVHKDVTFRLRQIDRALADAVAAILEINKEERHIRGGYATYLKYKEMELRKILRRRHRYSQGSLLIQTENRYQHQHRLHVLYAVIRGDGIKLMNRKKGIMLVLRL